MIGWKPQKGRKLENDTAVTLILKRVYAINRIEQID
jgi:hypothetical protein